MKVKIQRALLEQLLNKVEKGLKAGDPIASLVVLSAEKDDDGDVLRAAVSNENLLCSAEVDASKEKSIISIDEPGKAALSGDMLIDTVSSLQNFDTLDLEFDSTPPVGGSDDDDDDGDDDATGTLIVKFGDEEVRLQCVSRTFNTKIEAGKEKAVVSGSKFIDYCDKVGISAGKPNQSTNWSNISMAMAENGDGQKKVTFVTTNGQQLTVAEFEPDSSEDDFAVVLPYDIVTAVAKMCVPNQDVSVSVSDDSPPRIMFSQPISYAMTQMGTATYQVVALNDKFPPYEKVIDKLDFVSSCMINAKAFKEVCSTLAIFEIVRTAMDFSVGKREIKFNKSASSGSVKRSLSLDDADGDDMEVSISSRHFKVAGDKTNQDVITLHLSGKKSMGLLDIGDGVRMYFQPFTK
jgi:DNA polymerase III sliding clamp (beta) subunit (PCNA family)